MNTNFPFPRFPEFHRENVKKNECFQKGAPRTKCTGAIPAIPWSHPYSTRLSRSPPCWRIPRTGVSVVRPRRPSLAKWSNGHIYVATCTSPTTRPSSAVAGSVASALRCEYLQISEDKRGETRDNDRRGSSRNQWQRTVDNRSHRGWGHVRGRLNVRGRRIMQTDDRQMPALVQVDGHATHVAGHAQAQDGNMEQNGGERQAAVAVPHNDTFVVRPCG